MISTHVFCQPQMYVQNANTLRDMHVHNLDITQDTSQSRKPTLLQMFYLKHPAGGLWALLCLPSMITDHGISFQMYRSQRLIA